MYQCHGACAEVDSDTEAVAGRGFKLGCISCKKRSEVEASATVEWYFRPKGEADFVRVSAKPPQPQHISNVAVAETQSSIQQAFIKPSWTREDYIPPDASYFCVTFSPPSSLFHKNALESTTERSAEVTVGFACNRFCYFTPQGP